MRVGSLVAVVGLGAIGVAVWRPAVATEVKPAVVASAEVRDPPVAAHIHSLAVPVQPKLELVTTVAGLTERISHTPTAVDSASDEELMAALRATGQDPGIVRVDGRVVNVGRFAQE
jgi:hypothetical protein